MLMLPPEIPMAVNGPHYPLTQVAMEVNGSHDPVTQVVNGPHDPVPLRSTALVSCLSSGIPDSQKQFSETSALSGAASAPVSPGKKRVRINESTSVLLIEDNGDSSYQVGSVEHCGALDERHTEHNSLHGLRVRRQLVYFDEGRLAHHRQNGSAEEYADHNGSADECGMDLESSEICRKYEECTVDKLTFPESAPAAVSSDSDTKATLSPFRDSTNRVLMLHEAEQDTTGSLDGKNGTVLITDLFTGWPLKRSPSLESRDNPFLPGGDLSRETEELLKRATIVRDKFYLDQQERKQQLLQANNQSRGGHPVSNKEQTTYSADDGELPSANSGSRSDMDGAMEERISLPSNRAEVGVEFYPRENGKAGDNLDTSPAGIKLDVGGSPTADGHKAANNDNATDQSDRAKRRPKCCVVM